ncbi:MAG: class II fructose-bisphosphate aldolase [Arachnia sp.]
MRASTLDIVRQAAKGGYAVGAFNVFDDLSLRSVVQAASAASSPVIIQLSVRTARSMGVGLVTAMFNAAADAVAVPVSLHLDHCPDVAVIEDVVRAGWSSVLFDASHLDLAEAREQTRRVVDLAHAHGVEVESEIENIVGVEDGVGSDVLTHAYTESELVEIAAETGADLLAPQLGTAHGLYKGRPVLRPDRVTTLRKLTDMPIVLHGGTGLADAEFRMFIDAGVSKINVSTAIKRSYMEASAEALRAARDADRWEPLPVLDAVAAKVGETVTAHLQAFGSAGRATGESR